MKVVIPQSELLESLKTVSRAVSGQNTLPVLGNILIRAEGKKLHFAATNLEISIANAIEADIKNEGSITVPAKILTSYTSLLGKKEDIELKIADGTALELNSKSSKTKIKGISADEFPQVSRVEGGTRLELSDEQFREAVHQVAFAAQENASRPILAGVYLVAKGKELKIVATDSYRLSEKKITLEKEVADVSCVVPVRAFLEADRLMAGHDKIVITVAENQVMFSVGGTELVSRLIEGQFPPYEQILPKSHQTTIEVNREDLVLAVRRVSIFAKENNQHMKLEFLNDGTMSVSTDATQIGEEKTTIDVKIDGATNVIALNADYVLDVLGALTGDELIQIEVEGKMNPAVFKRLKHKDFVHLVMPLKV